MVHSAQSLAAKAVISRNTLAFSAGLSRELPASASSTRLRASAQVFSASGRSGLRGMFAETGAGCTNNSDAAAMEPPAIILFIARFPIFMLQATIS
jgi:hypothetical protein